MKNMKRSKHIEPVEKADIYQYGVYGLTEWYAVVKAGNAHISVPFTGGATSGYGCTPARFVTDSRALATIIESTNLFKQGKIVRL